MTDYDDYWNIHSRDFCINLPHTGICSRMDLFRTALPGKKSCMSAYGLAVHREKLRNGELLHQMFGTTHF